MAYDVNAAAGRIAAKKTAGGSSGGDGEASYEAVKKSAVSDLMAAFKSGDEEGAHDALLDFVRACVRHEMEAEGE